MRPFETAPSSWPGAADALQPARDRLRRLDLDHEVDRAHVDAELERRGGDEARDLARLQQLLDLDPLLARERAVVGARDLRRSASSFSRSASRSARRRLLTKTIVERCSLDELEELRVDRGPDRAPRPRRRCSSRRLASAPAPGSRMSSTRDDDLEVELLRARRRRRARSAGRPRRSGRSPRAAAASPRGRCAGTGCSDERVEPLEGERQVRAALRPGDGVHLVEDQRLDRPQHLAGLRGEHQEERLGRRDEDVRRLAQHRARAPSAACRPCGRRRAAPSCSPASGPRRLRSTS